MRRHPAAEQALELLGSPCGVCPRACSVDRLADERGLCRIGRERARRYLGEAVLRFVAEELGPDTYVNLMGLYYPAGKSDRFEEIDRPLERSELERAFEIADEVGVRRLDARRRGEAVGIA